MNQSFSAGQVSAVTWISMPTEAAILIPVPTMNERNEPNPIRKAFGTSLRSLSSSAQHGAQEGAEEDAHRREKEESREDAHRGADGPRARTAEPPGHPCRQEIVGDAHGDGHPEPEPQRRGAHLGVGGEIGAQQARIAQHHARQGGHVQR